MVMAKPRGLELSSTVPRLPRARTQLRAPHCSRTLSQLVIVFCMGPAEEATYGGQMRPQAENESKPKPHLITYDSKQAVSSNVELNPMSC